MGLFSRKKKVSLNEVADHLAALIMEAGKPSELQENLGEHITDDRGIDEERRKEWLILNMFALTEAVSDALDSKTAINALLDRAHQVIYEHEFSTHEERKNFNQLVWERYKAYRDILTAESGDNATKATQLGRFFAEKFTSSSDISLIGLLIFDAGIVFFTRLGAFREFLDDIFSKFELV